MTPAHNSQTRPRTVNNTSVNIKFKNLRSRSPPPFCAISILAIRPSTAFPLPPTHFPITLPPLRRLTLSTLYYVQLPQQLFHPSHHCGAIFITLLENHSIPPLPNSPASRHEDHPLILP
ncbi:hypothetical protein RND81_13G122600 [Saponaria officinalis]|uniref:Uncharacterized protein n=1 Tax=Saponaria officinalis TaxID=3572 RepID=A0AAW1H043_SAPOF